MTKLQKIIYSLLQQENQALHANRITELLDQRNLWKSPKGKTPEKTVAAALTTTFHKTESGGEESPYFIKIKSSDKRQRVLYKWNSENKDEDDNSRNTWLFPINKNEEKWEEFRNNSILTLEWGRIGDLILLGSITDIKNKLQEKYGKDRSFKNTARALYKFANEMRVNDIIYVITPAKEILGRGIVKAEYEYDDNNEDDSRQHQCKVNWEEIEKREFNDEKLKVKFLKNISDYTGIIESLSSFFSEQDDDSETDATVTIKPYGEQDFLKEVYLTKESYTTLRSLLEYKKNVIIQGAPGVGKTFAAKRLAFSIMGVKDTNRIQIIQFHQNYSYEDFVVGYRPSKNDTAKPFELQHGPFYKFCKKAEDDEDNKYYLIIDEINRGNVSKIFGELFMLIERDKRRDKIQLLYENEQFSIPENLYIIGMMNTADRSLAIMDFALRRRFAFFEFAPAFNNSNFKQYLKTKNNPKFNSLISTIISLNKEISQDESLGKGYCIGHSFFHTEGSISDTWMNNVIEYEIIPLLEEYWYENLDKVKEWKNKLRACIQNDSSS